LVRFVSLWKYTHLCIIINIVIANW
jgi:hypothetical protein